MNFASLDFVYFLGALLPIYWLLRSWLQVQNALLLGASYYFYACWDVEFLLLILMVTGVSYIVAQKILNETPRRKKLGLIFYSVFSLVVLGYFKYANFFVDQLIDLVGLFGFSLNKIYLDIVLPAAISFYIFESISFVVGSYFGSNARRPGFVEYSLFIAFFPKLVAGPIERPNVLLPQLAGKRSLSLDDVGEGLYLILLGLFKKVAIADGLAPMVGAVYDSPNPSTAAEIAVATLAFTLQIYGDFSGYSDIARGVSRWFGIRLSLNFDVPYTAFNPSEFWRRWHMSLSSWLRDYIYIPLGGNRSGESVTRRNLMATMLFGGLWHGAAWNFVAWGGYQGMALVIHRVIKGKLDFLDGLCGRYSQIVLKYFYWCVFFLVTCYGWLIFRASSFAQIQSLTLGLLNNTWGEFSLLAPPVSVLYGVPVLVSIDILHRRNGGELFWKNFPSVFVGILHAVLVFGLFLGFSNARSSFIYFQF